MEIATPYSKRGSVTFLRHGHAAPAQKDEDRVLDDVGKAQAAATRVKLGNPRYDLVVCSPMKRASETAAIVAGGGNPRTTIINELIRHHDPAKNAICEELFRDYQYAPLDDYLKDTRGEAMADLGKRAAWRILGEMDRFGVSPLAGGRVLIVGHAVILNAVVCGLVGEQDQVSRYASSRRLGEAGAFELEVSFALMHYEQNL